MPDPGAAVRGHAAPGSPMQAAERVLSATETQPAPEARDGVSSLIVLPIADLSPERDQEYFCDGIAEDLVFSLSKIDGLRIASRSAVHQLKGKSDDIRSLGDRLGVDAALEGSIRKAGNKLRINTQLTNVSDGFQLWSERFNREAEDVFEVQEEIADKVASALEVEVRKGSAAPAGKASAEELETYRLCLLGRHQWNRRTVDGLRKSLEFYRAAVEKTPDYTSAHVGLASSYTVLGLYGVEPPSEVMPAARAAAERALELDPLQSEAWAGLGCIQSLYEWSWSEGAESFRRAIEADPGNAVARQWFAINHLVPVGRLAEAERLLAEAVDLDPLSPAIRASRGFLYYFAERFEDAAHEFHGTLEVEPSFALAHQMLGQCHTEVGEHDTALAEVERAIQLTGGSPEMTAMLAYSAGRAGDADRARELLGELSKVAATGYVPSSLFAVALAGIGDREAALERLAEAAEARSPHLAWLRMRPTYRDLRSEPAFTAIVERLGFDGDPESL